MKPEQKFKKDDSTNFVCKADGNPKPSVVWYKGDEKVTDMSGEISSDRFTFKVKSPDASKTSKYRCVVSNKYGNISFEFVLIIPGNYAPDCLA